MNSVEEKRRTDTFVLLCNYLSLSHLELGRSLLPQVSLETAKNVLKTLLFGIPPNFVLNTRLTRSSAYYIHFCFRELCELQEEICSKVRKRVEFDVMLSQLVLEANLLTPEDMAGLNEIRHSYNFLLYRGCHLDKFDILPEISFYVSQLVFLPIEIEKLQFFEIEISTLEKLTRMDIKTSRLVYRVLYEFLKLENSRDFKNRLVHVYACLASGELARGNEDSAFTYIRYLKLASDFSDRDEFPQVASELVACLVVASGSQFLKYHDLLVRRLCSMAASMYSDYVVQPLPLSPINQFLILFIPISIQNTF